jgi:hypothetical protein
MAAIKRYTVSFSPGRPAGPTGSRGLACMKDHGFTGVKTPFLTER